MVTGPQHRIFDTRAEVRSRNSNNVKGRNRPPDRNIFFFWRHSPQWARVSSLSRFLDYKRRRTTVGRTLLDEWSARRTDLYLTTLTTDINAPSPSRIRTHSLSRREPADLRLRPRGHWDRLTFGRHDCCCLKGYELTALRFSTQLVEDSAFTLCRNSSYFSNVVSRCSRFCNKVDTSFLIPGSIVTHFWVMARTCAITRSSLKSYGKVSVHSASSCTKWGTKRPRRSCKNQQETRHQRTNLNIRRTHVRKTNKMHAFP